MASAQEEIFLSGEEAKGYRKQLWLDENGMMGYLEIPSIRVYLPIYHGTEEAVLQKGVGHLSWTSLPIEGKSVHSVLSGHRGLPSAKLFTDLDQLREDDAFSVHILGSVLTYQVEQICVVAPTETEALRIEPEKNYCTLMTCTPYGVNTQRLLIRGILTDTEQALLIPFVVVCLTLAIRNETSNRETYGNGKELTMGDLLGCDEKAAEEAVVAAYRKNIIGQVENITEDSIRGAFDIMEYWMAQDGMHVSIPAYGVASYAAGPQEVTVTAADVTGGAGDGSEQNAEQPPVSGDSGSDYNAEQPSADSGETITVIAGIQADAADFIFPYSSERALTDADLVNLEGSSVEEEHYRSQLAINEILARYGYVFHPEYGGSSEEAYDQFNGKAWYEAAKPYCPSTSANDMLYTYITDLELSNINVICEWQKAHNCYY